MKLSKISRLKGTCVIEVGHCHFCFKRGGISVVNLNKGDKARTYSFIHSLMEVLLILQRSGPY